MREFGWEIATRFQQANWLYSFSVLICFGLPMIIVFLAYYFLTHVVSLCFSSIKLYLTQIKLNWLQLWCTSNRARELYNRLMQLRWEIQRKLEHLINVQLVAFVPVSQWITNKWFLPDELLNLKLQRHLPKKEIRTKCVDETNKQIIMMCVNSAKL